MIGDRFRMSSYVSRLAVCVVAVAGLLVSPVSSTAVADDGAIDSVAIVTPGEPD